MTPQTKARANTALLQAASAGAHDQVVAALRAGAEVDARDGKGRTALMRSLIGDLDLKPDSDAAVRGAVERIIRSDQLPPIVQTLLKAGAKVDAADADGWTALCFAVQEEQTATCRELVRRKADLQPKTRDGARPLTLAVKQRNPEIVELLLNAGADPRQSGAPGSLLALAIVTPKPKSADQIRSPEDFRALVGATDPTMPDRQFAIAARLLKAGADPNERLRIPGETGEMPLLWMAVQGTTPRLVRLLIGAGAKVDQTVSGEIEGTTALHIAALAGRADMGRVLLEAGANPNAAVKKVNGTPLAIAAGKGRYSLAEMLLKAGAQPDTRDADGKSARDRAAAAKLTALVRLLDSYKR